MTDTGFEAPITRIEKIKTFTRSRDGWTMILAFAIAVVSSIFMAGLLPVEDDMSAFGVVFIYFVTMIIIAGLIRMAMRIYDKFSKSSSS
jgi:FlaA1/EpsC-like NDP-sugar epimerase